MAAFFIYSVKTGACLAWFYLFHKLLLSRETFHGLNRLMLLTAIAASLLLPLVHITLSQPVAISQGTVAVEGLIAQAVVSTDEGRSLTLAQWLFLLYLAGVAFFLLRGIASVVSLLRLMRRATLVDTSHGIRTLTLPGDVSPFSWFRYIVLSEADWKEQRREILLHERAHIARGHSLDVLLASVLIVFQWFNPAAWLIKRELQAVHEFEADEAVLSAGVDARAYQMLLIRKAVGERLFAMANNLTHNSLKKRIKMMNIQKSNRAQMLKAAAIVPLAALAITAFANNKVAEISSTVEAEAEALTSTVKTEVLTGTSIGTSSETLPSASMSTASAAEAAALSAATEAEQVKTAAPVDTANAVNVADVMPKFEGNLAAYLGQNLKYPAEAIDKDIQGRVDVRFIVSKEGKVCNASIVHGVDPSLDAEALRLVNAMPKWTPGTVDGKPVDVWFTIPISFRMTSGTATHTEKNVIVIDGTVVPASDLSKIDQSSIASIAVKKDEATKKQYGVEGEGSVILVTTKK